MYIAIIIIRVGELIVTTFTTHSQVVSNEPIIATQVPFISLANVALVTVNYKYVNRERETKSPNHNY